MKGRWGGQKGVVAGASSDTGARRERVGKKTRVRKQRVLNGDGSRKSEGWIVDVSTSSCVRVGVGFKPRRGAPRCWPAQGRGFGLGRVVVARSAVRGAGQEGSPSVARKYRSEPLGMAAAGASAAPPTRPALGAAAAPACYLACSASTIQRHPCQGCSPSVARNTDHRARGRRRVPLPLF